MKYNRSNTSEIIYICYSNDQNENSSLSCSIINCDSNRWIGAIWFYLKPKYEGKVKLQSIHDETTVYFDDFGVPHLC
jgi:hypothetical protein